MPLHSPSDGAAKPPSRLLGLTFGLMYFVAACGDDAAGTDPAGPRRFEVPLEVGTFQAQDDPNSSTSFIFGTFPVEPQAVRYAVELDHPNPNLEFQVTWEPGDPIPERIAVRGGDREVPGYDNGEGTREGEYFVVVARRSCSCAPSSEMAAEIESGLRVLRTDGTMTITVE